MVGEWTVEEFVDLIDFQEGPGILAKDFRPQGTPLVRLAGLDRGASVLKGCDYLDPEMVKLRWSHFALKKGDILLSTSASLGRIAVVGDEGVGAIAYTGIIRMRPQGDRVTPKFIRYLLEGPEFQYQAEIAGAGSVIRHFGPMHLRQMRLSVPPITEQEAIAGVLSALDDKIEVSRRVSETLEEMARSLFKSWFIDFDPVRAKSECRDPGLPKALADLFPTRLVDSELGEIPEGWAPATLADLVSLNPESWTKATRPELIRYVDLSNTKWGRIDAIVEYSAEAAPSRAQRILRPGDTLIGTVRPGNGSYVLVADEGLTGSTGFAVLRPRAATNAAFVYLAATAPDNIDTLARLADGGAYPAVAPEIVAATPVVRAPETVLAKFAEITTPWLAKVAMNERESRKLGELRDALLPKLISGEIRVPPKADPLVARQ